MKRSPRKNEARWRWEAPPRGRRGMMEVKVGQTTQVEEMKGSGVVVRKKISSGEDLGRNPDNFTAGHTIPRDRPREKTEGEGYDGQKRTGMK
jgi:hypothetical protein